MKFKVLKQKTKGNSTLPVYTESKRSDKNFTSSETVFSRVDHYVGHSWWSLVTSDVVTSDQWPSGVTHIVINPRKTVLLRVRFFHSVWLSVDRQWTFFNDFLNHFAMVRASWTVLYNNLEFLNNFCWVFFYFLEFFENSLSFLKKSFG